MAAGRMERNRKAGPPDAELITAERTRPRAELALAKRGKIDVFAVEPATPARYRKLRAPPLAERRNASWVAAGVAVATGNQVPRPK